MAQLLAVRVLRRQQKRAKSRWATMSNPSCRSRSESALEVAAIPCCARRSWRLRSNRKRPKPVSRGARQDPEEVTLDRHGRSLPKGQGKRRKTLQILRGRHARRLPDPVEIRVAWVPPLGRGRASRKHARSPSRVIQRKLFPIVDFLAVVEAEKQSPNWRKTFRLLSECESIQHWLSERRARSDKQKEAERLWNESPHFKTTT